jgi:hypothetical protein
MSSKINYKRVWSPSDAGLTSRVSTLENNEYKITYFESVSAATGTITKPAQSTILLDQFFSGIDAYVSTIVNGQPTGILPQTSGGTPVDVSSFDAVGNYTLTGTPSAFPVAIIYVLKIKSIYYSNLNINNILDLEDFNAGGGGGISGLTTNELVYGNSATSIASLPVATYPSLTELSYVKGVTSAIQTQLAGVGEWINLGGTVLSPADSTTYNFGLNVQLAPGASTASREFTFIKTGTVTRFIFTVAMAGGGTSETVAVSLRNITTATDNSIGNITMDAGTNGTAVFNFTPSIAIANTTDRYTIKFVCPAWVTNPTGVYSNVRLFNKY